jgi:hypothetical protein
LNASGIRTAGPRLLRNGLASLGPDDGKGTGMGFVSIVYATAQAKLSAALLSLTPDACYGQQIAGCASVASRIDIFPAGTKRRVALGHPSYVLLATSVRAAPNFAMAAMEWDRAGFSGGMMTALRLISDRGCQRGSA